jgi:hypothetical protein
LIILEGFESSQLLRPTVTDVPVRARIVEPQSLVEPEMLSIFVGLRTLLPVAGSWAKPNTGANERRTKRMGISRGGLVMRLSLPLAANGCLNALILT